MIQSLRPVAMGAVMAPMMLWMLHGQMTTGGGLFDWAVIGFVGAHVGLVLAVIFGAVFAARLSPRAKAVIDRLHRPSLRHIGLMLIGMAVAAGLTHLAVHGGLIT